MKSLEKSGLNIQLLSVSAGQTTLLQVQLSKSWQNAKLISEFGTRGINIQWHYLQVRVVTGRATKNQGLLSIIVIFKVCMNS